MAPGFQQILIVGLIVLLLFGASRLGDIGKGLGEGIKNFKKGISSDNEDDEDDAKSNLPTGEDAKKSDD